MNQQKTDLSHIVPEKMSPNELVDWIAFALGAALHTPEWRDKLNEIRQEITKRHEESEKIKNAFLDLLVGVTDPSQIVVMNDVSPYSRANEIFNLYHDLTKK